MTGYVVLKLHAGKYIIEDWSTEGDCEDFEFENIKGIKFLCLSQAQRLVPNIPFPYEDFRAQLYWMTKLEINFNNLFRPIINRKYSIRN